MIIPPDDNSRFTLYEQLARDCMVSQYSRRAQYDRWKRYYMLGCDSVSNPGQTVNKIYPHVDQLTAFMYSQETTTFSIDYGVSVSDLEFGKIPPMIRQLNEQWHDSDTDITFGVALTWAWVYGSMFIKPQWRGDGIACGIVEPHNFGVLREDAPKLSLQEAFVHEYLITKSQLERELAAASILGTISHDRVQRIMKTVASSGSTPNGSMTGPANIVVTTIQPLIAGNNMMGGINPDLQVYADYGPKVAEPLIQMRELYVWNDEKRTYQIVTMADPFVCVWDRPLEKNLGMTGEFPFIQVAPSPLPDYFWGASEIERLIPLQDLRNTRMQQIRHMMDLQANPPTDFSGYTVTDEIFAAFDTPGGRVSSDMPNSKVTKHQPDMPSDLLDDIDRIDAMFEEASGVNNVLSGRGETGVRSAGHASQLARLGSARAKKRAMIIEDSLDNVATYYVKLLKKHSIKRMRTEEVTSALPVTFIAEQFPEDFHAKVANHSNSPVFMEDTQNLVFEMLKAGMIDKEQALAMLDVPNKQLLQQILKKKIEPAAAAAQKEEQQLKVASLAAHKAK